MEEKRGDQPETREPIRDPEGHPHRAASINGRRNSMTTGTAMRILVAKATVLSAS
jgi:hypothetical protein